MCDINEEHRKNVVIENDNRVSYMKVERLIYGCIQSIFLWYDIYANRLKDMGFEINPYDKCIANKVINGNQCTIGWCVNDNKISHKKEKVVDDMSTIFKENFGNLTITRGNSHNFLGMNQKIRKQKRVEISMRKKIEEAIEMFGEEIKGKVLTPAAKQFLWIDDTEPLLDQKRKDTIQSVTDQCLYITKGGGQTSSPLWHPVHNSVEEQQGRLEETGKANSIREEYHLK